MDFIASIEKHLGGKMPKGKGWNRGEDHYKTKHPDYIVAVCRERYLTGRYSYSDLMKEFDVSLSTMRDWLTYRTRINAKIIRQSY